MDDDAPELTPEQLRELAESCLQLNIEADFFALDKSIFANKPPAETIAEKLIKKSIKVLNENKHIDPLFYLLFEKDGAETVFGINLKTIIDLRPTQGSVLVANIMSQVEKPQAYATVFAAHVAKRPLSAIRDDRTLDEMPARGQALVAVVQYEQGDKSYLLQRYGRSDDIIFWEPELEKGHTPDHAIPGRFWNLFYVANQLEVGYDAIKKKRAGE